MNALLLNLDFINDIVHPKGKIAAAAQFVLENNVIQQANLAIATARKKSIPIVHVKVGFSHNYIEAPKNSPIFNKAKELGALKIGEWGTEFHELIDVCEQDILMTKHRVSALYATPLEAILRAKQIDKVIITGVTTNMAVESVARELHDRDYDVIILKDACAAATKEIHEASLKSLERIASIMKVKEFMIKFS